VSCFYKRSIAVYEYLDRHVLYRYFCFRKTIYEDVDLAPECYNILTINPALGKYVNNIFPAVIETAPVTYALSW